MEAMTMTGFKRAKRLVAATAATASLAVGGTAPAIAQYRQHITNDMAACAGEGPAVRVTVNGIRAGSGTLRVQAYRGTAADWMQTGRWLNRIETPANRSTMSFCLPLPATGTYAVAVRHDANGNGKTDITRDGGGMSNNPSINIFNLGKPSVRQTAVAVGNEVKAITITLRYM